jgi:hypothetical protein
MGCPVKACGIRVAARARLLACSLCQGGQTSSEVLIGRSHAMRLERRAPLTERLPELAQHTSIITR